MYKQTIRKIGNSAGIIIPKTLLEALGIGSGTVVDIELVNGELIVKSTRPKYTLKDLVSKMTSQNEHLEVFVDPPIGAEIVEYKKE